MNETTCFKALGNEVRLALLRVIAQGDGMLSVLQVEERVNALLGTDYAQPTISHHLAILADAGFIEREYHGLYTYYRVRYSAFVPLMECLEGIVQEEGDTRMPVFASERERK